MKTNSIDIAGENRTVSRDQFGHDTVTVTRSSALIKNLQVLHPGNTEGDFTSPNSFAWNLSRKSRLSGTVTKLWYGDYGTFSFGLQLNSSYDYVPFPLVDYSEVYNQCLSECFEDLRNAADWSITAAQSKQTSAMVGKLVSNVRKVLTYVRRFDFIRLHDMYREFTRNGRGSAAAQKWLEFQYGWKPLAQDCYNTVQELGRIAPSLMRVKHRRVRHTRLNKVNSGLFDPANTQIPVLATGWSSVRCEMNFLFEPNQSFETVLSNFTSMNPASMAWELVPFSFVFDWFLDFGGYLRNLESAALLSGQFRGGYYTLSCRQEADLECVGTQKDFSGNFVQTVSARSTSPWLYQELRRNLVGAIPLPWVPGLQLGLGVGRLQNALALLAGARR